MDLKGSVVLVTGGTGSFGHHFVERLLQSHSAKEIRIFSRDEKKQYDMRNEYRDNSLNFVIGDVRDKDTVMKVMKGVDYVFHAAALKHVPNCEFFPLEAIKTNILGASNVLDASEECGVRKVIILSTDKAVYPINAMGMTKALMEKLMLAKAVSRTSSTVFCGIRYGNVMYSRGSVLPLFVDQVKNGRPITMTSRKMTRFLLPLPVAIDLVLFALEHGENGDILVRKSPASTVEDVAHAIDEIFGGGHEIKEIGIREGEKIHETLVTKEEMLKAESYEEYFRIKNLSKVDFDEFYTKGQALKPLSNDYTSENTTRLTLDETKKLILSLREIKQVING